jgi:hypothetical protein
MAVSGFMVENRKITVTNSTEVTVNYNCDHKRVPTINIISVEETDANYNWFVEQSSTKQAILGCSQNYTGVIHVRIMSTL